jgi:hypothetical protein
VEKEIVKKVEREVWQKRRLERKLDADPENRLKNYRFVFR